MKRDARAGRRPGGAGAPGPRRGDGKPSRAKRSRFWRGWRGAVAVAALAALALAGRWWWASRAVSQRVPDPNLARALIERGIALTGEWRLEEALASFRQARDRWPEDDWLPHDFVANTASQLSSRNMVHAGLPVEATRSSVERVALVNEALREYDAALRLVRRRSDAANILSKKGDLCFTWGLQWEAEACYQAAAALEPQNQVRVNKLAEFRDMLAHPENQLTTEEAMILAGAKR